jgi:predicted fused transcriptional regulator/phosphomethylpyrimidine kinase
MSDVKTGAEVVSSGVETQEQSAQPQHQEQDVFSIDDLLAIDETKDPLFTDDARHKGIMPLDKILPKLHPEVKANLANLRAQITKKQQVLAEQTKKLEESIRMYQTEREALTNSPWAQRIQELAKEAPDVDPWSPEGIDKLVEHKAAQHFQKFLEPLREKVTYQQQKMEAESFISQNPDLKSDPEIRKGVAEALMHNPDAKLSDVYWAVKGKVYAERERTAKQNAMMEKSKHRETIMKTSIGSAGPSQSVPNVKKPDGQTDIYELYKFFASQKKR